jgi:hypothetical protein
MATTGDIEAAIAALRVAEKPNISQVARDYNIERTRLSKLFRGKISTREDFDANRQLLSPQQDRTLLELVKRLTKDGLPPTPKLVRQFAKDLSGILPGKNWPHRWLDRHQDELQSGHLRGFDLARKKADSFWQYKAYFDLVIAP